MGLMKSPTCHCLEVDSPFPTELISKKQESSQANYSLKHVDVQRFKLAACKNHNIMTHYTARFKRKSRFRKTVETLENVSDVTRMV